MTFAVQTPTVTIQLHCLSQESKQTAARLGYLLGYLPEAFCNLSNSGDYGKISLKFHPCKRAIVF